MLIVMRASAREEDIAAVCARVESLGYRPHVMPGAQTYRHRDHRQSRSR